ncbi:hypothetical protein NW014_004791 [Vibrio parahaemolyticus]|nr:hypothetical protein [Vibrio parahaemolyticus]EJG0961852.1 hypothetical protein [Vibrio parahaemolyticus]EJS4017089.1 hypothetical protein [Vibrio parahaemolyticus]
MTLFGVFAVTFNNLPNIDHLVLEYHHEDGRVYVLDNRYSQIYQAGEALHAQTVVTFDLHNMWIDGQRIGGCQARMKKWVALLKRYRTQTAATLEKKCVRFTQRMRDMSCLFSTLAVFGALPSMAVLDYSIPD